ncbi:MAG: hypothetical protein JW809_04485 [Pirellulales bacterium]|nr:hypothetical protein [Pirellulales bacterium]
MMMPDNPHPSPIERFRPWVETALVFLVFFVHGAWPVPDVNEPHYLGKTIHYWNPDWIGEDFFLDSHDTHLVFYVAFGWLSLWLGPVALAWTGRLITWALLAWAWRRLAVAVLPRPWWSVASAAVFVLFNERFHMAGEWIVGGVEAKSFAYAAVLFGLEALVVGRWNRAWLLFGLGAMFHVLVGGWAAVAALLAWGFLGRSRPALRSMWPGLAGGFLLSLPSLIPSLQLTWGVDPAVVDGANQIYVFARLYHHLDPGQFPSNMVLRFAGLMAVWVFLRWRTPDGSPAWSLHAFVAGAVALGMIGMAIAFAAAPWPGASATLLKFYWFRLADVAVPLGVALGAPVLIERTRAARPRLALAAAAALVLAASWHVGQYAVVRPFPTAPRAYRLRQGDFPQWRDACEWIAHSGRIPPHARFLTPRMNQTFRWYAQRSEVVAWKDIPQDAPSILGWWRRLEIVHGTGDNAEGDSPLFAETNIGTVPESLAQQGPERLRLLGRYFGADYVITEREPRLDLPVEYENDAFIIYRLDGPIAANESFGVR